MTAFYLYYSMTIFRALVRQYSNRDAVFGKVSRLGRYRRTTALVMYSSGRSFEYNDYPRSEKPAIWVRCLRRKFSFLDKRIRDLDMR